MISVPLSVASWQPLGSRLLPSVSANNQSVLYRVPLISPRRKRAHSLISVTDLTHLHLFYRQYCRRSFAFFARSSPKNCYPDHQHCHRRPQHCPRRCPQPGCPLIAFSPKPTWSGGPGHRGPGGNRRLPEQGRLLPGIADDSVLSGTVGPAPQSAAAGSPGGRAQPVGARQPAPRCPESGSVKTGPLIVFIPRMSSETVVVELWKPGRIAYLFGFWYSGYKVRYLVEAFLSLTRLVLIWYLSNETREDFCEIVVDGWWDFFSCLVPKNSHVRSSLDSQPIHSFSLQNDLSAIMQINKTKLRLSDNKSLPPFALLLLLFILLL